MKHCPKHDILFPEGGECWNCEESAMSVEDKDRNYRDPHFLSKRGGINQRQLITSRVHDRLSQLSEEQLERLMQLAAGAGAAAPAPSSGRTTIG